MRSRAMLGALAIALAGSDRFSIALREDGPVGPVPTPEPRRERITKPHQGAKEMARRRRQMERDRK